MAKSGYADMFNLFKDQESQDNNHCFSYNKDDILRSELQKYIIGKLESAARNKCNTYCMTESATIIAAVITAMATLVSVLLGQYFMNRKRKLGKDCIT